MDKGSPCNKVYINPNFNRFNGQRSYEVPIMHVNPAFSLQHNFATISQNPRIHVNPNFVKSVHYSSAQGTNSAKTSEQIIPSSTCLKKVQVPMAPAVPTSTKSRYTLIRNEQQRSIKRDNPERQKSTIAINKYKSVPVNEVKKSISRTHPSIISNTSNRQTNKMVLASQKYNRFKFTRQVSSPLPKDFTPVIPKTVQKTLIAKKYLPQVLTKYKYSKGAIGKLKKNNIPCPLYRKYGKCLRKDKGQCNYLHDKKHVSLCTKFLKGLCHDKDCLFSHDLTSKKMPTCHFYLKGMCSKENCPYLHVKLNDNTKICSDFLKGYCEKGSECLKRHINMCPDMETTGACKKRQCPYPHNNKSKKETTYARANKRKAEKDTTTEKDTTITNLQQESAKDSRYYMDNVEVDNSKCEIKPSRIKIGTLPSFIKL